MPSLHDLDVVSEDPNFDRGWAHIVAVAGGASTFRQYVLQVRPVDVQRHQYGTYPLLVVWREHGGPPVAAARCELTIKPCVRVKVLQAGPGELSLSIKNCSETGIEVSVTVRHHGSGWSKGWEFELGAGDGPFEFSESFGLPSGTHGGALDLSVSAEGVTLFERRVRPGQPGSWRRWSRKVIGAVAAIAVAGGAAALIAAFFGPGPALRPQAIAFTSVPPGYAKPGTTYHVAATGGRSGNPVTFAIDPSAASVCSVSGGTVAFNAPGTCVIDANQAGNARFRAARQAQQTVTVGVKGLLPQAITFTTTPPSGPLPGTTYHVAATGGRSGSQVNITTPEVSVCSIKNGTVTFNSPGTCVIDANQSGNADYQAAPQAQQTVQVRRPLIPQVITFTTTPPSGPFPGDIYPVAATGGPSGIPVNITTPDVSVCSIKNGTVTFNSPGTCVIDANQSGNANYLPAPQAEQTVTVNSPLQ